MIMMAVPGSDTKGACYWCFKTLKWIPVLFIVTIVVWSYYAYIIQLCLITVQNPVHQVLYLTFYHVFFFMFCWSYCQTIFTDIGNIPNKYKVPDAEYDAIVNQSDSAQTHNSILEVITRNLPITNVTLTGGVRFCEKCRIVKPDRAHHCSVCGVCVPKMDHHCPWINNCVSFTNYKFFVLFLGYALLYCLYVSLTALPYFIAFWRGDLQGMGRFHILFLFFVAVMFGVSLLSLFVYHCYLVCENRTTLEAFRPPIFRGIGPDKHGFHIGRYNNFLEVFGKSSKLWFLPVSTSLGDGLTFPQLQRHEDREGLLQGNHYEDEPAHYYA